MLCFIYLISPFTGIAATSPRNFFPNCVKTTLNSNFSAPVFFSWKVLSIHRWVFSSLFSYFIVSSFISIFFPCEIFSFFIARITAPLRFPASYFLCMEETRPVNYSLIYLCQYIHIVIFYRDKIMLKLYYSYRLLHFVFIISPYSPLLIDPHLSFSWTERCFHGKKEISSRTFQWKNLAATEKSYRNWREKFSQYTGKFLASGVNKSRNVLYYK